MSNVKLKYTPHPQQRMVHEDNHRFKVIVCGRRFGKTTLAINEMIRKAAQFSGDYWYISPTYKMSKSIAWDMLKVYTPDILKRKVNESELLLEMINGSRIWLKGADDEDKLRGVGLDGVLLDEFADMKSSVWSAVVRPMLMDRKGWAIFLGTPKGQNHFYEHFIRDPKTHDEEYRDIDDLPIATDEDYKSWKFKTSDNPFISRSEIEKLRRELPEETYNQEVEASFENFTGLVYKEYNRMQKELTLDTIELQPWWDVYIGIDTGKYTGVVFMAIDDEGNEYIFDEIFDVGGLCSDISTQIKHKMANRKVKGMVIDSASQVKREYTAHGLYFQDSQKDILSSIQMTRRKHRDKTLYITKDCRALIRELKSRRWEEKSAVTKPVKEDDHLCFDGETMIMCDNVERPISNLLVGDRVSTPYGLREVTEVYTRDAIANEYEVAGRILKCTKEHKIFANNKFIPIDAVGYSDIVHVWEKNGSYLTGQLIIGMASIMLLLGVISTVVLGSIKRLGYITMAIFLMVMSFTIKTIMLPIMILTILSLWMHQAIGNTTAKRIKEILSGLKSKELTSIKIGTLQKHGIVLMKAVDGIVSTEKKLQEIESLSKLYVSIAVKPMTLIVTRVSIVRGLVSRLLGVRVALMMLYSNVSSVIRILPKINTQRKRHALQYANANIKAIGNCQKVYSISIEGLGCYYANGILVSNSNALDYIQFTFLQYPKEPRPQLEVNRDLEWDKLFKKKNILKNEKDWRVSV